MDEKAKKRWEKFKLNPCKRTRKGLLVPETSLDTVIPKDDHRKLWSTGGHMNDSDSMGMYLCKYTLLV